MAKLTDKQCECLIIINLFIKEKGHSPTVRELAKEMCCKSPATVHTHLKALKNKKYIKWTPNRARSIEIMVR